MQGYGLQTLRAAPLRGASKYASALQIADEHSLNKSASAFVQAMRSEVAQGRPGR